MYTWNSVFFLFARFEKSGIYIVVLIEILKYFRVNLYLVTCCDMSLHTVGY